MSLAWSLLWITKHILAAPISQSAADDGTATAENNLRDIQGIIWSCLVTVFSCVWVCIHPNIPGLYDSELRITLRRTGMFLVGLMAPEFIAVWAIRQWMSARYTVQKVKESMQGHDPKPEILQRDGLTIVHGFFAGMGGFVLHDVKDHIYPVSLLELEGLYLSGRIEFPNITAKEIRDRSKGDGLAKGFIIAQTGWFLLQVIARITQGLAVTELEITAVAFATMSFITYGFWWNKPLNVQCPVHIYERVALGRAPPPPQAHPVAEDETIVAPEAPDRSEYKLDLDSAKPYSEDWWATVTRVPVSEEPSSSPMSPALPTLSKFHPISLIHNLSSFATSILEHVIVAVWAYGHHEDKDFRKSHTRYPTFYCGRVELAIPLPADAYSALILRIFAIQALLGIVFGGIHCSAWLNDFPTSIEKWLWVGSSLGLVAVPAVLWMNLFLAIKEITTLPARVLGIRMLTLLVYAPARVFLMVEAFVMLRNLPESALKEAGWKLYIPHI